MAIHTPSIGAPVHAPHVSGWAVAAAAAVLVIGAIIVIQPKWAPSTTTTADEAAAAQQAYRAGERAMVIPVDPAAAHQAHRIGERATLISADQATVAHQAYRADERAAFVATDPANSPVGSDRRGFRVPGGFRQLVVTCRAGGDLQRRGRSSSHCQRASSSSGTCGPSSIPSARWVARYPPTLDERTHARESSTRASTITISSATVVSNASMDAM